MPHHGHHDPISTVVNSDHANSCNYDYSCNLFLSSNTALEQHGKGKNNHAATIMQTQQSEISSSETPKTKRKAVPVCVTVTFNASALTGLEIKVISRLYLSSLAWLIAGVIFYQEQLVLKHILE